MKNKWKIFCAGAVFLLVLTGVLAVTGSESQAKRLLDKPQMLMEGKTYSYDIDGDNKIEKIMVESEGDDDNYIVTTTVYADGKQYAKVKEKGCYSHTVVLCDLYSKKKGMNLIVYGTSDSDCIGKVQVYKLGAKKMTKIAQMKSGTRGKLNYIRMLGKIKQGNEEGAFYIYPDTPFYLNYFGCYYTKVKCQIQGNKIKWNEQKNYSYEYKYTFRLQVNMSLYSKADLQSQVTTLKPGIKMTVKKIQPIKRTKDGKTYSFVQVTTASGKTGWIYDQPIVDYENYVEVFKSMPAWG
ncbi:MAG: SH3 domain-containing protein [Eubacterium sp.]|nr:SH3 domain-containing protein [Eubacterium sp.]